MRQRFTVAHELAHHVLEHGARDLDTPDNFILNNPDAAEVDATKFAAQLLIPEMELRALVEVRGVKNIMKLANMFHVSRAAMTFRLRELGYAAKY